MHRVPEGKAGSIWKADSIRAGMEGDASSAAEGATVEANWPKRAFVPRVARLVIGNPEKDVGRQAKRPVPANTSRSFGAEHAAHK